MSYSKFDLTFKIGQYLDRHLVFPLLEFLAAKEVKYFNLFFSSFWLYAGLDLSDQLPTYTCFQTYDQSELLQAKLEILSKTNMIDYVIDIRKMLYPDEDTPEVC